jgi:hypothetical protein
LTKPSDETTEAFQWKTNVVEMAKRRRVLDIHHAVRYIAHLFGAAGLRLRDYQDHHRKENAADQARASRPFNSAQRFGRAPDTPGGCSIAFTNDQAWNNLRAPKRGVVGTSTLWTRRIELAYVCAGRNSYFDSRPRVGCLQAFGGVDAAFSTDQPRRRLLWYVLIPTPAARIAANLETRFPSTRIEPDCVEAWQAQISGPFALDHPFRESLTEKGWRVTLGARGGQERSVGQGGAAHSWIVRFTDRRSLVVTACCLCKVRFTAVDSDATGRGRVRG